MLRATSRPPAPWENPFVKSYAPPLILTCFLRHFAVSPPVAASRLSIATPFSVVYTAGGRPRATPQPAALLSASWLS
jgi:hypothetical protein